MKRRGLSITHSLRSVFWSSRGATPGKRGSALLYGHTYDSKPSGVGVLDHLGRVKAGAEVVVAKGAKKIRYTATKAVFMRAISVKQMARFLSHFGQSRLAVITCHWNKKLQKYDGWWVVRAVKKR